MGKTSRRMERKEMNAKEALEFAKKNDARQVDLRFTDLPGLSQHISYPRTASA